MGRITLLTLSLAAASAAFADFSYSDFSNVSAFQLNGTAHQVGNFVRMTRDQINFQAGNMWHTTQKAVGLGFSTTFQFRCFGAGGGSLRPADGMAFGVQTIGTGAIGRDGWDNAMGGIHGSMVVNFRSFWNTVRVEAFDRFGSGVFVNEVPFFGLHRPAPWTARIDYDAITHGWQVWLDGTSILTATFDMASVVPFNRGNYAFVGLGAATGGGFDNNDALAWHMTVVPEPATMLVLAAGLLPFVRRRRRR